MGFASTFWEAAQTSDSSQASGEDFCQESPLPFTLAVGPHKGKQFASLSRLIMHNYMVTRVKSCSSSFLCFFDFFYVARASATSLFLKFLRLPSVSRRIRQTPKPMFR
jgi:hypothetical protein